MIQTQTTTVVNIDTNEVATKKATILSWNYNMSSESFLLAVQTFYLTTNDEKKIISNKPYKISKQDFEDLFSQYTKTPSIMEDMYSVLEQYILTKLNEESNLIWEITS